MIFLKIIFYFGNYSIKFPYIKFLIKEEYISFYFFLLIFLLQILEKSFFSIIKSIYSKNKRKK